METVTCDRRRPRAAALPAPRLHAGPVGMAKSPALKPVALALSGQMSARFDRARARHALDRSIRVTSSGTICRSAVDPRSWCHGARHGQVLQAGQGLGGHYLSRSARRLRRMGTFQRTGIYS
jgi:hypothetical protein